MDKIGFVGLGNMGRGMSINLSKKKYEVIGFDTNSSVFQELEKYNIQQINSLVDVAKETNIIITMLPDGKAVKSVWNDLIEIVEDDTILVDCSTIDVKTSLEVQKKANSRCIETLDAPVSGGVVGANNGTLTFMIGGKSETFRKVENLFNIMGSKSILCGNNGAGQTAKICNNMLLASTMIAVGESFKLGKNLGLDLNKLFDVLSTSSGSCWAINTYCPIKNVGPESPSDNEFKGGFSTNLMKKDLTLAIEAAIASNTEINFGQQTLEKFVALVDKNEGHLDFSNIVNHI